MSLLPTTALGVREADDETLAALRITAGGAGLVLGTGADGERVVIQLFGPEPVDDLLVGGLALRQLLVFRVLALGAYVIVQSGRPEAWAGFGRVASGRSGTLTCVADVQSVPIGRPNRPVLVLLDSETSVGSTNLTAGPWSAVVAASDQITQWNVDDVKRADLTIAGPMSARSAREIGTALSLPDQGGTVAAIADDQLSLISRGHSRTVRVALTDAERWVTGAQPS